jgi:hypothetical protein
MPDWYEFVHADCLNYVIADANGDPDADNLASLAEMQIGTLPCVNDTDTDGCADGEETASNITLGGDRNPTSRWDFFDVPAPAMGVGDDGKPVITPASTRNKAVSLQDVGVVLAYVGRSGVSIYYTGDYNGDGISDGQHFDRSDSTDLSKPWRLGPPNGAVSLQDVGFVLAQVGHTCTSPP